MATLRSKARVIWENIANGILYRGLEEHSIEHHEALEFLAEVAKRIVEADNEPNDKRRDSIVRAVKLSSKVTKNEYELRKAIEVVDDFTDNIWRNSENQESKLCCNLFEDERENY